MDANERRERASAEAADWWLLLKSNEITHAEREQYVVWLRESAVHVSEMLRMARLHKTLTNLNCWDEIDTDDDGDGNIVKLSGAPPPRTERRTWAPWALAASLAAVAMIAVFAGYLKYSGRSLIVETQRGERHEVALRDGSIVQMDPQTKLRLRFDEGFRDIELEHGRALFRVAKDSHRPFVVRTGNAVIRALGTAFAVDRRQRGITVTVSEGKVAVTQSERLGSEIAARVARLFGERPATKSPVAEARASLGGSAEPRQVVLNADEQVTLGNANPMSPVHKIDSSRELAWTQGRLVFQNTRIVDAIEEFNRYNQARLRVVDASAATYPVTGTFDANDIDSFVAFLKTVSRVSVIREDDPEHASAATR